MNVAKLLYVGKENLHYTEAEIMNMTLRKFYLIYDEYLKYHRLKSEDTGDNLLDSI